MEVGIRELKAHLSELVERAAQGELIRVTDRGRPKAMLVALPGRARVEEGLAEGWIRRPSAAAPVPYRHRWPASRTTAEIIDEDRGP